MTVSFNHPCGLWIDIELDAPESETEPLLHAHIAACPRRWGQPKRPYLDGYKRELLSDEDNEPPPDESAWLHRLAVGGL